MISANYGGSQSFDNDDISVSGRLDSRSGLESTTEAQAEGAIEGTYLDYMIQCDPSTTMQSMHCEHSPRFKFSRFDSMRALPRNVSNLSGIKRLRQRNHTGLSAKGTLLPSAVIAETPAWAIYY